MPNIYLIRLFSTVTFLKLFIFKLEKVKFICGGIHNYYITNKPTE